MVLLCHMPLPSTACCLGIGLKAKRHLVCNPHNQKPKEPFLTFKWIISGHALIVTGLADPTHPPVFCLLSPYSLIGLLLSLHICLVIIRLPACIIQLLTYFYLTIFHPSVPRQSPSPLLAVRVHAGVPERILSKVWTAGCTRTHEDLGPGLPALNY